MNWISFAEKSTNGAQWLSINSIQQWLDRPPLDSATEFNTPITDDTDSIQFAKKKITKWSKDLKAFHTEKDQNNLNFIFMDKYKLQLYLTKGLEWVKGINERNLD